VAVLDGQVAVVDDRGGRAGDRGRLRPELADDVVETRRGPVDRGHLRARLRPQALALDGLAVGAEDAGDGPVDEAGGVGADEALSAVVVVSGLRLECSVWEVVGWGKRGKRKKKTTEKRKNKNRQGEEEEEE
jgi:hypothetical protein